ncbi:MAG: glycosyltransferase family 9 protein [Pirellulales bacterium]|nr:glycosyltransferase family 9 protein [Pirellulales bacterium]
MNEQQSRALDYWIGVILCWLLTRWRRLRNLFGVRDPGQGAPRRILFIKLAEMGAIALSMPAFEAARRRVGLDNLFCLMLETNREMHDLVGFFPTANLISIRDKNLLTFALDVWRLMRRCRREGIDTVIDLEGFARVSAVLAYLTGARTRVGFDRYSCEGLYRGDLFTHRVWLNYYQHASAQFLALVAALDGSARADVLVKQRVDVGDYRLPTFEPSAEELAAIDDLLARRCGGPPGRPLVILKPNLIDLLPLRRWPRERFLELGRRLLADAPGATIVLTGLPKERALSEELAAEISPTRCVSLAGDTTIRTLATLFTRADLLVTSDCGPAHMAAFTDLPIVSIFGPETPRLYAPLTPHNTSLWAGLACSPCLTAFNHRRSTCRDNACMQAITVEQVFAAARAACPPLARQVVSAR